MCDKLEATRLEILDAALFYESWTLGIVAHGEIRIGLCSVSPLEPQFLEGKWPSLGARIKPYEYYWVARLEQRPYHRIKTVNGFLEDNTVHNRKEAG